MRAHRVAMLPDLALPLRLNPSVTIRMYWLYNWPDDGIMTALLPSQRAQCRHSAQPMIFNELSRRGLVHSKRTMALRTAEPKVFQPTAGLQPTTTRQKGERIIAARPSCILWNTVPPSKSSDVRALPCPAISRSSSSSSGRSSSGTDFQFACFDRRACFARIKYAVRFAGSD